MADLNPSGAFSFAPATFPGYNSACYYPPSVQGASTLQRTLTANLVFAMPFFCRQSYTFSGLSVFQDGAGTTGNMRLGIYNDSSGLPGTLKTDAGTVAFPGSTGIRTVATSLSLVQGNWYWLAGVADAALVVMGWAAVASGEPQIINSVADHGLAAAAVTTLDFVSGYAGMTPLKGSLTYGALPTPFPTLTGYGTSAPMIFLKG